MNLGSPDGAAQQILISGLAIGGHQNGTEITNTLKSNRRTVSEKDIAKIRQLFSGTNAHVLAPADEGYDVAIQRWSKAAEKRAGVAVLPTTSEEVAIAVKYASEQGIDLAVKGGGHSTSGASSTEGGLCINLGRMQNVEVDTEKQQLHIQGGALWKHSDATAWKHGLATVGGGVDDTGVGGLTLGGGYGHLSGTHGLVIDNTVAFTVVLADGSIVKASKESNPDLFWAMNGAGQNFGVTTEFVLQAYPQKEVYASTLLFAPTPENISRLVAAVNDIFTVRKGPDGSAYTNSQGRASTILGFGRPPPAGGQTMLIMITVFNGTEAEAKTFLQPFHDIGPLVDDSKVIPFPVANTLAPAIYGMRSTMKGCSVTLPMREEFVLEVQASFDQFLDSCPDAAASLAAFELYDPCKVAQGTQGCFANRGYHLNSLIMAMWTSAENDQRCRQFARDVSQQFKDEMERAGHATGRGLEGGAAIKGEKGAVMLYGNYDQYEERSRDIFGVSYDRLQALKAKYDPSNMFNKLFAITPKAEQG